MYHGCFICCIALDENPDVELDGRVRFGYNFFSKLLKRFDKEEEREVRHKKYHGTSVSAPEGRSTAQEKPRCSCTEFAEEKGTSEEEKKERAAFLDRVFGKDKKNRDSLADLLKPKGTSTEMEHVIQALSKSLEELLGDVLQALAYAIDGDSHEQKITYKPWLNFQENQELVFWPGINGRTEKKTRLRISGVNLWQGHYIMYQMRKRASIFTTCFYSEHGFSHVHLDVQSAEPEAEIPTVGGCLEKKVTR